MREMQNNLARLNRVWLRDAAIASLLLSFFFGLIGPLGDYQTFPIATRLLAWIVLGMSGFAIYALLLFALDRFRPDWPWLLCQALVAIIGSALFTPILSLIDFLITGDQISGWLLTYVTVLPIGLVYLVIFEGVRLARRGSANIAETSAVDAPPAPSKLMRRLPEPLRGKLVCIAKEDHYLRVYTDQGNDLIRLRMSDALMELETMNGQQTHRSWWVADDAVQSATRRPTGGGQAILTNGLKVPIARARMQAAREAGWFDR
ncbi:MAG: LytTR family DNA-binding domain-containing protein [Pseudomonadota bacterium]